jgi:hypothetical protein
VRGKQLSCLFFDQIGRKEKLDLIKDYVFEKDNAKKSKQLLMTHLYLTKLLATASTNCYFAIMQNRTLVNFNNLLASLYHPSVPYIFKRMYLRFLYETYLVPFDDIRPIKYDKLYLLFKQVIYPDLRRYVLYFDGLIDMEAGNQIQTNSFLNSCIGLDDKDTLDEKRKLKDELILVSQEQQKFYDEQLAADDEEDAFDVYKMISSPDIPMKDSCIRFLNDDNT